MPAGRASRFRAAAGEAGPATKLVAQLHGKPLVRHVAEAALASRARPVIVVTGHADEAVRAALDGLDVSFVANPDYESGIASSLKRGCAAVPATCAATLVLLGDMPLVSAAVIDRLVDVFAAEPGIGAVAPTFDGKRGNPVLISRALFPQVAHLSGDVGAKPLLAGASVREVPLDDEAVAFDVDTPDALTR